MPRTRSESLRRQAQGTLLEFFPELASTADAEPEVDNGPRALCDDDPAWTRRFADVGDRRPRQRSADAKEPSSARRSASRRQRPDDRKRSRADSRSRKRRKRKHKSESEESSSRIRRRNRLKKSVQSTALAVGGGGGRGGFDQKEMPAGVMTPAEYASSELGRQAAANARTEWRAVGQTLVNGERNFAASLPGFGQMNGRPGRAGGCVRFLTGKCFDASCPRFHPENEQQLQECLVFFAETYCKYGASCRTAGCLYKHPEYGQMPVGVPTGSGVVMPSFGAQGPCRWGMACRTPGCPFKHPNHWSTAGLLPNIRIEAAPKALTTPTSEQPEVPDVPRLSMPSRI